MRDPGESASCDAMTKCHHAKKRNLVCCYYDEGTNDQHWERNFCPHTLLVSALTKVTQDSSGRQILAILLISQPWVLTIQRDLCQLLNRMHTIGNTTTVKISPKDRCRKSL